MTGKLRKFLALPASDKRLLLWAAAWLPLTHIRLKLFGLQFCLRAARPDEAFDAGRYQNACHCDWVVALASRHGAVTGTCLSRSLTVIRLMARLGMAGQLRIGVSLEKGGLDAHAWVEFAGVPLQQGTLKYEAFPPLSPHGSNSGLI